VQCAVLDASARASWRAIPDGRRRDRDRFDRDDRVSGYYTGVGTRVGISGCAGSAESGEARPKRGDLFGAVPLRAAAGQAGWEEAGVKNHARGTRRSSA
jgi:hypothetical protein